MNTGTVETILKWLQDYGLRKIVRRRKFQLTVKSLVPQRLKKVLSFSSRPTYTKVSCLWQPGTSE